MSRSRPPICRHTVERMRSIIARHTGRPIDAGHRRRGPRPLVRCRDGARLRLRRPRRHVARRCPPDLADPSHRARPTTSAPRGRPPMSSYTIPMVTESDVRGRANLGHLQPAAQRPHHLPGHADRRWRRQRGRRPTPASCGPGTSSRHPPVHELAGRSVHVDDGDLRHHAVRCPGHRHHLRRPGDILGRNPPGGRCTRQARRAGALHACCCTSRTPGSAAAR